MRRVRTLKEVQEDRRKRNARRVRNYRDEYRSKKAVAFMNGYSVSEWEVLRGWRKG